MLEQFFTMKDAGLVLTMTAGLLAFAIVMTASQWRKLRQAEIDAALKQEMIQRGMSADDIVKILKTSSQSGSEEPVAESARKEVAG